MALNLAKTIINFLKDHPDEKYTPRELADWVFKTFPDECQAKKESSQRITTDADLIRQIVAEISAQGPRLQKRYPEIKVTEGYPRKLYYTEKSESTEIAEAENETPLSLSGQPSKKISEHDLYPILSSHLWNEFGIYSKRVDEKRSSNKRGPNGNRWLYPDVVGVEDLGAEWDQEIRDCVYQYSDKRTKLWSFEVKLLINGANIRECFFQAVSNSSWANFGYLVTAEIAGPHTLKELRMLFAAHGIGLIKLNVDNPADSQVMIPAQERSEIDWDMANRLAAENKDFLEYIKLVRQFYQTGDLRKMDWDVPAEEE